VVSSTSSTAERHQASQGLLQGASSSVVEPSASTTTTSASLSGPSRASALNTNTLSIGGTVDEANNTVADAENVPADLIEAVMAQQLKLAKEGVSNQTVVEKGAKVKKLTSGMFNFRFPASNNTPSLASSGPVQSSTLHTTTSTEAKGQKPAILPHGTFFSPVGVETQGPQQIENNHPKQADALLEEVYNLLDRVYSPRDVGHADARKPYLTQLYGYQQRRSSLTTADYTALEQLQAQLLQQQQKQAVSAAVSR
jgi:hypothetical protein